MKLFLKAPMLLSEALTVLFPETSKRSFSHWIKGERVLVDGAVMKRLNTPLEKGAELTVRSKAQKSSYGLNILFQDKDLIVVDKPAGILSVKSDNGPKNSLHDRVKKALNQKVYVVHRLDRETSGVILFALSDKAYQDLKKQFFDRTASRTYAAIVEGVPPENSGQWTSYVLDDALVVKTTKNHHMGKIAISNFEIIAKSQVRSEPLSLLKVKLKTGRKNQIRVQAKEAGLPIVGDKKYGSEEDNRLNPINRLGLHASSLIFTHPGLKKSMCFFSSLPKAFLGPFKKDLKRIEKVFSKAD